MGATTEYTVAQRLRQIWPMPEWIGGYSAFDNPLSAQRIVGKMANRNALDTLDGGKGETTMHYYRKFLETQFHLLITRSGLEVIFTNEDPYVLPNGKPSSVYMVRRVEDEGKLFVFAGDNYQGPVGYAHNLLFRAVHDAQHIATGGSFSFRGEVYTALPLLWAARTSPANLSEDVRDILFSEMVMQSAFYTLAGSYMDPQEVVVGCWREEYKALGFNG